MLSLSQTHDDRRLIRVIVAPIGNNSLFADQFQIVSSLKSIPFYELNRPINSKPSPFKFLNWKDGELLFEYLRYDRSSAGPGDLDDFQSSKRIWMVMGLVNFPEFSQVPSTIPQEIEDFTRRYGHIGLKRIFVFNYNFDVRPSSLQLRPLKNDPDSLIIFPPEGACEGGSMIVVHFKEVMCHATVKLISVFERFMEICEDARVKNIVPAELPLHTVYDDRDDIGLVGRDSSVPSTALLTSTATSIRGKKAFKKRPSGRLQKWMGDLSMQVCSPLDAIDHYIAAIVELRSTADPLWLAGALDGYALVVTMLKERQFNLEEIIGKDLKTVTVPPLPETDEPLLEMNRVYALSEERMVEAISIYSSSVVLRILEVEATLRLARILEKAEPFYEREQRIVDYVMKAASIPGLNSQQQIEVTIEGALICYRLGLKRKYALFLYIAALMTAESGNYDMADSLLMQTFLRLEQESGSLCPNDLCGAWNAVKAAVFTNGVILAQETNNSISSSRFLAALLQIVCATEFRQTLLNTRLSKFTNKLLGLEKFIRNNNNFISPGQHPPLPSRTTALTEESLKQLQASSPPVSSEKVSNRRGSATTRESSAPMRTKSVASDLTAMAGGGLKGSIRSSLLNHEIGGVSTNSLSGSAKLSNPMASPKPSSLADRSPSGFAPAPPLPSTPTQSSSARSQGIPSEKLTPSQPPNPPLSALSRRTSSMDYSSVEAVTQSNSGALAVAAPASSEFLSNQFTEFTSAAESALKQGLRVLSVPNLPQKFSSLISSSGAGAEGRQGEVEGSEATANMYPATGGTRKSVSQSMFSTPSKALKQRKTFNDRFVKSLLEANIFDSEEDSTTAAPQGIGGDLSDPRVLYHLVDVDHAKEVLQSLSTSLNASSLLPVDQQEIALDLFYQIAENLQTVESADLPVKVLECTPLPLPGPLQPIPCDVEDPPLLPLYTFDQFLTRQSRLLQERKLALDTSEADSGFNPSANHETTSTFRFIVDPFSKRKEKKSRRNDAIYWNGRLLSHVKLVLNNPLTMPIHLTAIKLVATGCNHVCFPLSLDIPPETDSFEVFVPVICLERGVFSVEKVQLMIGNFLQEIELDSRGRPILTPLQQARSTSQVLPLANYNAARRKIADSEDTVSSRHSPGNRVQVVDEFSPWQCFCSWSLGPLLRTNGPTSNHLEVVATKLCVSRGEIRPEKVWLRLPRFYLPATHRRLFQISVHEYTKDQSSSRKYLLHDFFSILAATTPLSSATAKKVLTQGNYNSSTSCILQRLQQKLVSTGEAEGETDWLELSFDLCHKPEVVNLDLEVETLVIRSDICDAVSHYFFSSPFISAGPDETLRETDADKREWVESMLSKQIDVKSEAQKFIARKLVLRVNIDEAVTVSCNDIRLVQFPPMFSSRVQDDRLFRQLLLQQWDLSQRENRKLLSIASIAREISGNERTDPPKVCHAVGEDFPDNNPVFVPMLMFQSQHRIRFDVNNHSMRTVAIGSNLDRLRTSFLSSEPIGAPLESPTILTLQEVKHRDLLLSIPANTCVSFVIEYSQEHFSQWRAKMDTSLANPCIPLYWMYFDCDKISQVLCLEETEDVADCEQRLIRSAYQTDYLRFGRIEVDLPPHKTEDRPLLNLFFQSDHPPTHQKQTSTLSEIGRLLNTIPTMRISAVVTVHPNPVLPATVLPIHHVMLSTEFEKANCDLIRVHALQKVEIVLKFSLFDKGFNQALSASDRLEVVIVLVDHYKESALRDLQGKLDRSMTSLEEGRDNESESDDEEVAATGEKENAIGSELPCTSRQCLPNSQFTHQQSLSYLVSGKLHCKHSLLLDAPNQENQEISHRIFVTFLHPSRYSLYTYFRVCRMDSKDDDFWWNCEVPLRFVVVNDNSR